MIKIKTTGDFSKTTKFLEKASNLTIKEILHTYGKAGVKALAAATPTDTGKTASMWGYKVSTGKNGSSITWTNDSMTNNGIPIVILLQYGHATRSGAYVTGTDFINPALKRVMDSIAESVWREVTKV